MMARPKGGGGDAREKLIRGMGRGFRLGGYGGIGVDGLAKESGLTSGAFYANFRSKSQAFTVTVDQGLACLRDGIAGFQRSHGEGWLAPFVDFYLGPRMEAELADACALPTFSADVARAADETRAAFTAQLTAIATLIAQGLSGEEREARAWRLLAILSGGAAMARAVDDAEVRAAILRSAGQAARAVQD